MFTVIALLYAAATLPFVHATVEHNPKLSFDPMQLATNYSIDERDRGRLFLGYGVNPSAGTFRLLHDYPEPQRTEILDFMFSPFGAAFHRIKVEIGGDGQGTDGAEASHMRTPDPSSANFSRGYTWWVLAEAKKRNPEIETYALAESWPRWVHGNASASTGPLDAPSLSARYITTWVLGAKQAHNLTIDWVGLWNEHWEADAVMFAYCVELRRQLDAAGLHATRIIGPDAFVGAANTLANQILADPDGVGAAIAAIGVHGGPVADPTNPNGSATWRTGLPLSTSEDGSTYGDVAGALARVTQVHAEHLSALSQGSNFWNPWSGYYPGLPFALHSLMDAHHPWAGHYRVRAPIWTSAHLNQHTSIGMSFLNPGPNNGVLASGCGTLLSYVAPSGANFTIVIERTALASPKFNPGGVGRTNTTCVDEVATFTLQGGLRSITRVVPWVTQANPDGTIATLFQRQPDIFVVNGVFRLTLPVNSIITITSLDTGGRLMHPTPPDPEPFPLPYADSFEGYPLEGSRIARYFADMSGAFEVDGGVLRQQTPAIPIGWYGLTADTMPYTIIGALDWADITVTASVYLPQQAPEQRGQFGAAASNLGWVAVRLSQTAEECDGPGVICSNPWGLFAVLDSTGELRLHLRLAALTNPADPSCVFRAPVKINPSRWSRVSLTVVGTHATVLVNGETVANGVDVSGPLTAPGVTRSYLPQSGFAALGGGPEYSTELAFDNFSVAAADSASGSADRGASPASLCGGQVPAEGMVVVGVPCGLDVPGLAFDIVQVAAGRQHLVPRANRSLCMTQRQTIAADGNASTLMLQPCSPGPDPSQDFLYDRAAAIVRPVSMPPPPGGPSPWQGFTPGQGVPYGHPFGSTALLTAVRDISISHSAPYTKRESLKFFVNNKSQGVLNMPAQLPDNAVGCVATCNGGETVTPVAPAAFDPATLSHGRHVTIGGAGASASWPSDGTGPGCNEVALLTGTNLSFTVKLSGQATFVDFGWCSPSIAPSGTWPSADPSGWMGEQGVGKAWIFRSAGQFKASDSGGGPLNKLCLETVSKTDRGQVRPWAPATVSKCSPACTDSSWAPSCGGSVFYDAELGLLRTAADTTAMCFGVCR